VTESPQQSNEPGNSIPAGNRVGGRRWQIGLRTVFLLVAAIAVWLTYFINRRENASLAARIETMVPLAAHELVVDDPTQIAVVKLDPTQIAVVKLEEHWAEENRWEIHLPDRTYRLCLATRGINEDGLAPIMKSSPLAAGRHLLALDQQLDKDVWHITTLRDEASLISLEETKEWSAGSGIVGGGYYSQSEQLAPDRPLILYRRRFMRPPGNGPMTSSVATTDGVLLWIEPAQEPKTKP
jgi:hypothetical protein